MSACEVVRIAAQCEVVICIYLYTEPAGGDHFCYGCGASLGQHGHCYLPPTNIVHLVTEQLEPQQLGLNPNLTINYTKSHTSQQLTRSHTQSPTDHPQFKIALPELIIYPVTPFGTHSEF